MIVSRPVLFAAAAALVTLLSTCPIAAVNAHESSPPVAKKMPKQLVSPAGNRVDDYYWLRDDTRSDSDMLAYLAAENAYTDAGMAHTKALQDKLFAEITGRLKKDDASVPVEIRGYWYYTRFVKGGEYPIYARKKASMDAAEEIVLDGNKLAEGKGYYRIGDTEVSTNNQLLAYSEDTAGRRIYSLRFKDLATGKALPDVLADVTGQVVWANDNRTVFYIKKDLQTLLGDHVYRHELGTPQDHDVLVYEEKDKSFYTSIRKSRGDKSIFIDHDSTLIKGTSALSADTPGGAFKPVLELEKNHEYSVAQQGDWYYIRSNWNATNFRLMKVPVGKAADKAHWQEVIGQRDDVFLSNFVLFDGYLVVSERQHGLIRLRIIDQKTGKSRDIGFDDPAYLARLTQNPNLHAHSLRYAYSSFTTPNSIYEYDLASGKRTLLKRDEVVGGFNPSEYASERLFIRARDGVEVPVSIAYRRDKFQKDGSNPMYQYGYGSYGITVDARFSASLLSLLDRGFVYALVHVRGGQMLGRQWYEDGKLLHKKHTFTDFIDATKALVQQKYAARDKVFAVGGSAGGLLMGAVANLAPGLYRGIAAHVPFVDVVTTMLDASIPLTTNEYDEWGNPNEKKYYDYMLSYSPYDQVKAQDYPNLLVTTGLYDSQVQYFEPTKWVAKLRTTKTDHNKLFLHINMEAGHGGKSGRYRRFRDRALEYAFFLDLLGVKQ